MKKIIFMSLMALSSLTIVAQNQQTIAAWNFDKWLPNKVLPAGQFLDAVIYPDSGKQVLTAKLGTEQMFDPAFSDPLVTPINRKWSAPSAGGYVRCGTDWVKLDGTERFFQMSFSTTGLFNVSINSSHATSGAGTSYQNSFTVQYRIGDGAWTNFNPIKIFDVTQISETGITYGQVTDLKLPAEANGKVGVDVRWLFAAPTFVTSDPDPNVLTNWQTAWNTGTQVRIDNISVKGYQVATSPTIFNSYSDIDFGEVVLGQTKTITIPILASKVSGTLAAATTAPFSLSKTSLSGTFNEFNTTLDVTFTPTMEGIFQKTFTLTGTGVSKTVQLKGVSVIAGLNQPKTELDYVTGYKGIVTINAPESKLVTISDLTGRTVIKRQVERGITTIALSQGQLYIVSIGNSYKKIVF